MKTYGLKPSQFSLIREILARTLGSKSDVKAFLFGSRATGRFRKNSDIDLLFGGISSQEADRLRNEFEDSDLPFKVDVVRKEDLTSDYRRSVDRSKRLIWQGIPLNNPWRICPVGFHWVRRHLKGLRTGKVGDWDGHCRANPSGKEILTPDELDLIKESDLFKKASPRPASANLGFPNGTAYDDLISGWTAYWNDQFQPKVPLHPNFVKALIASESGFEVGAYASNRKSIGKAQGLLQLTEKTQRLLAGKERDLKDHLIALRRPDIWDPNKNIAAGVRWLFRKRETARVKLQRDPSWEEVLFEYKGILKQRGERSDLIRRKVNEYLSKLKME